MTNETEMPMDGTEFNAVVVSYIPYRYKLYKPSSNEAKSGIKGRWQRMNNYGGWENTDIPPTSEDKALNVERIEEGLKIPELRGLIAAAGRCANNSVNASIMGSASFQQSVAARDYIDEAIQILDDFASSRAYIALQGGE